MKQPYENHIKEIKQRSVQLFLGLLFSMIIAYYERINIIYALILPIKNAIIDISFKKTIQSVEDTIELFTSLEKNINFIQTSILSKDNIRVDTLGLFNIKPENLKNLDEYLSQESLDFVYLNITEAFTTQLQISIVMGIFISLPIFWIQIYFFLAPGLYKKEQNILFILGVISQTLLLLSTFFTKDFLLPQAWSFFLSFGDNTGFITETIFNPDQLTQENSTQETNSSLSYMPSLGPQVTLFIEIIFAIILTSQLPIIFFLIIHWGYVRRNFLVKGRPWVIILILLWSAIISPPDLFSQIFVFIPLFTLYELTVFFLFCKKQIKI